MLQGEYLGMRLTIEDVDKENLAFFHYCAQGDFRLQKGKQSALLRYPPTTACPWTRDREYEWVSVEGKGAVHSYVEVHHAIQPAFREHVPYMIERIKNLGVQLIDSVWRREECYGFASPRGHPAPTF